MQEQLLRNNPFNIHDWLVLHPYFRQAPTDIYYVRLCNQLLKANINHPTISQIKWLDYKMLTCTLVCYFEDVISETNIWRSFIKEHHRRYGKYLPYYVTTGKDYLDDEINKEDVQFLIWHFYSTLAPDELLDPLSPPIESLADDVFTVLMEEYENAPQNHQLQKALMVPEEKEFFETRNIMEFLFYKSYLNHFSLTGKLIGTLANLNLSKYDKQHKEIIRYDTRISVLFNKVSPILGLRANQQLALLMGEDHPRYEEINSISKRLSASFAYLREDDSHLVMKHFRSGKEIHVNKSTIQETKQARIPGKTWFLMSVVEWNNEWALMGSMIGFENDDPERLNDEPNPFEPVQPKLEALECNEECFRELNRGGCLAYFEDSSAFVDYINEERKYQFHKYNPGKEFPQVERLNPGLQKDCEYFALFYNHHSGTEIYPDYALHINDPNNPFYVSGSLADLGELLLEDAFSAQFIAHLVNNNLVEFDPDETFDKQLLADNLDFTLRYFKRDDYFTEPRITLVNS